MNRDELSNRIEPPLQVDDSLALTWDESADVVVIGFGGAGACAAIEAAQLGKTVIAVDRFSGGGATAYSGGVIYAGGTSVQKKAGVDDTVDEMRRYLEIEIGNSIKAETIKQFCAGSRGDIEWLTSLGVKFDGPAYLEKTSYPPDKYFLYYSGNEKLDGYHEHARPAPRGHRTLGHGFTGATYFQTLRDAAQAKGVRVLSHSRAMRLIADRNGRVVGVEVLALPPAVRAEHERLYREVDPHKPFNTEGVIKAIREADALEQLAGIRRRIKAEAGLILATGGYIYNLDMLKHYQRPYAENFPALLRLGSAGCDGSGIQLGASVGGALGLMENIFSTCNLSPPSSLLEGILVNKRGQRFINEGAYLGFVGQASAAQEEGIAWLVIDGAGLRKSLLQIVGGVRTGLFKLFYLPVLLNILMGGTCRSSSPVVLGAKCGIDGLGLAATVAAYNEVAKNIHASDPHHKLRKMMRPLTGSYYAINFRMDNKLAFRQAFTLGGLRVDENTGVVLRDDGTVIQGLYAAGRTAVGLCSEVYVSGMSLADGVFSGRRAARACVKNQVR